MLNERWTLTHLRTTSSDQEIYELRNADTAELIATVRFEGGGRNIAKLAERVHVISLAPHLQHTFLHESMEAAFPSAPLMDAAKAKHDPLKAIAQKAAANEDCPACGDVTDYCGYCDQCGKTYATCRDCGKLKTIEELDDHGRCGPCRNPGVQGL